MENTTIKLCKYFCKIGLVSIKKQQNKLISRSDTIAAKPGFFILCNQDKY